MGHAEHNLRWTPKASGVRSGPGACMFTWIYLERFMEQNTAVKKKTTTRDMTTGNIAKEIMLFALPLMFGNIFQMLYNTVDSIVVGNYVSTEALAAVGATTMIVNMAVFFFNGFSIGAGVIIGRYFGAKNMERLHDSIETTMATTFVCCVLFTIIGILGVPFMLNFMATPDDVMADASIYLRTYFAGIAGLLIYNIGSGILRAVGDTRRPLYFLVLTSVINIGLDLLFVLQFHLGIFGVALATIISQFISAGLTLLLLLRTKDVYRLTLHDCRIDPQMLRQILAVGLPAGIQSVITAFSPTSTTSVRPAWPAGRATTSSTPSSCSSSRAWPWPRRPSSRRTSAPRR